MVGSERFRLISVIGAGYPTPVQASQAYEVGRLLAEQGFGVVCGGLDGVMYEAAHGAAEAGGLTVGILPGLDRRDANPWCKVVIPTGLGQARNVLVVAAGLAAVAVGGGGGTLSEIGHALKMGRPVVGLGTWEVKGVLAAADPEDAVKRALAQVRAD